jgi:hypothetical protein
VVVGAAECGLAGGKGLVPGMCVAYSPERKQLNHFRNWDGTRFPYIMALYGYHSITYLFYICVAFY